MTPEATAAAYAETTRKLIFSLGYLVASFGSLESYLQSVLAHLITRHQDVGMTIASIQSFEKSVQLILQIAGDKIKTPALADELKDVAAKWRKAEQMRNTFVHSNYVGSLDPHSVTRMKVNMKTKITMHEIKPEEIMEAAKFISQVYEDSVNFVTNLQNAANAKKMNLLPEARDL
jgi:hypothetical protein